MKKKKHYAAFLSFASPDTELVTCLRALLRQLKKDAFFSPQSLQELAKTKTEGWRRKIIAAVHDSECFVPIYTRHSLRREWVLYESGVADAYKLHRLPARAASVSPSEIEDLPSPGAFVYNLSDKDHLARLITNICVHDGDDEAVVKPTVYKLVHSSPLADEILKLAQTRWVFIAGNYPDNAASPNSGINWFTNREQYLERLKNFCVTLTEVLLDEGFSVSACPQVDAVGMHVIDRAVSYLDNIQHPAHVDFAIGGIHPIDREAREKGLSETARRKWHDHIMEFRKSYLANQEWIILIGGNEGTKEEHEAAKKSKVKVLTIPCFGGIASTLPSNKADMIKGACAHCIERQGLCDLKDIQNIVSVLKG